jgi:hypothetical protein
VGASAMQGCLPLVADGMRVRLSWVAEQRSHGRRRQGPVVVLVLVVKMEEAEVEAVQRPGCRGADGGSMG